MEQFRILYLRDNVLAHSETLLAQDVLEAIERATLRSPEVSAEVWSGRGKVAVIGPSPARMWGDEPVRP